MVTKITKPPPVKNGTNDKPQTPSGHGVVHEGRQSPRNGNVRNDAKDRGNSVNVKARTSSSTRTNPTASNGERWWEQGSAHPAEISASLHRLADSIYQPGLGTDPDRAPGKRSSGADERRYATKVPGAGRAEKVTPARAAARPAAQKTASTKTTTVKGKGK